MHAAPLLSTLVYGRMPSGRLSIDTLSCNTKQAGMYAIKDAHLQL